MSGKCVSPCPGDLARIRCGGHHDVRKPVRPDLDYDVSSVPVGEETSRRKRGRRRREGTARPAGAADHTGRSRPAAAGDHCSRRQRPSHGRPRVRRRSAARRTGGADPHGGPPLRRRASDTRGRESRPPRRARPPNPPHARPPELVPSAPRAHAWTALRASSAPRGPGHRCSWPPGRRPPARPPRPSGPLRSAPRANTCTALRVSTAPKECAPPARVRHRRLARSTSPPGVRPASARVRAVRGKHARRPCRGAGLDSPPGEQRACPERLAPRPSRAPSSSGRQFPCPRRAFPPPARRLVGRRGARPRTPARTRPLSPPGATSWPPSAPSAPPPPVPEPAAGSGPAW